MRPDGTRVKGLTPIVQALPYIMPKRFDAQNWASDYVDEEIIKQYIRQKRRQGQIVTHMSVLAAAYYKAALENPKVNYFVMNRKVYRRNHFCFSFVILKTRADGTPDETALKVFLEPGDDVFTISRKIREHVERNQNAAHNNRTDRFANLAFFHPRAGPCVFGLAYHLDQHGLLPRWIIDLSPFHTSLFITIWRPSTPGLFSTTATNLERPVYLSAWESRCRIRKPPPAAGKNCCLWAW